MLKAPDYLACSDCPARVFEQQCPLFWPNGEGVDAVLNGARSIASIGRLISAPGCALRARLPALSPPNVA
jgi:hypothetical protein